MAIVAWSNMIRRVGRIMKKWSNKDTDLRNFLHKNGNSKRTINFLLLLPQNTKIVVLLFYFF